MEKDSHRTGQAGRKEQTNTKQTNVMAYDVVHTLPVYKAFLVFSILFLSGLLGYTTCMYWMNQKSCR